MITSLRFALKCRTAEEAYLYAQMGLPVPHVPVGMIVQVPDGIGGMREQFFAFRDKEEKT